MSSEDEVREEGSQAPGPEGEDKKAEGVAEEAGESPAAEAPTAEAGPEARPLDVLMLLRLCIRQLEEAAWQKLGLHGDPLTGKVSKDLSQARVAIDCTVALVEQLLPHLQGQEKRNYQALVTDLRMNFVKQSEGV